MTKEIPLTQGKVAIVDDEDYEWLTKKKWHVLRGKYAVRSERNNGSKRMIYMHREIMNPPPNLVVDHINGDTLDNRKANLRVITFRQNLKNQGLRSDNSSGYKGVWLNKQGRWVAEIHKDYHKYHIGVFDEIEEAARMYNFWAVDLHGEYARLNEINGKKYTAVIFTEMEEIN